jgi:hypothetical protein
MNNKYYINFGKATDVLAKAGVDSVFYYCFLRVLAVENYIFFRVLGRRLYKNGQ